MVHSMVYIRERIKALSMLDTTGFGDILADLDSMPWAAVPGSSTGAMLASIIIDTVGELITSKHVSLSLGDNPIMGEREYRALEHIDEGMGVLRNFMTNCYGWRAGNEVGSYRNVWGASDDTE